MTSIRQRPKRYTELVHQAEDGRRDPLTPGCWVVVSELSNDQPLTLALVVDGPSYLHMDGYAIDAVWLLHSCVWRSVNDLTRLDLAGVLEEVAEVLAAIRRGRDPAAISETILRIRRAACLARAARPAVEAAGHDATELVALVEADEAVADLEQAWSEMVRVRLPNLAAALAAAGACELARSPGWTPGEGRPHPAWVLVETGSSLSP